MRTPEMSDEELDALFRRGAEAYPDDVHLGAWSRMEDKLNEDAMSRILRRKIARFFAIELVLVGLALLVWQISWRHRSHDESTIKEQPAVLTTAAATQPQLTPTSKTYSAKTVTPAPRSEASMATAPAIVATPNTHTTKNLASISTIPTASAEAVMPSNTLSVSRRQLPAATRARFTGLAAPKRHQSKVVDEARSTNTKTYLVPTARKEKPSASIEQQDKASSTAESSAPQTVVVAAETASAPASAASTPPTPPTALAQDTAAQKPVAPAPAVDSTTTKTQEKPTYRLLIGALGAPSLSAVRTIQTARMGGDLGFSLEYRLTNRLRVRASLIRSVKRYKAASEYYTAPPEWGWRSGDYEVNGNCRITEIPIDFRYDLVSQPSHSIFFSAGMNSLLMRNERYSYDYYVNGTPRTVAARVENGANFVLSVVNLSAGIERQLSTHLSFQAEPFVQLPLGNVGAGQVRLSSAGLLFSIKYGFLPSHRAIAP